METQELVDKIKATKEKWDAEAEDETDALLSQAISMAIEQGKGWASPAERERYLQTLLDDDYIPPLFAETPEELEKSGLKDAFTTLHNEGETPGKNMLEFRKKGNESVALGRKNVAKNMSVGPQSFFVVEIFFINLQQLNNIRFLCSTTEMLSIITTKHIIGLAVLFPKMKILYQLQRNLLLQMTNHISHRKNWMNCVPLFVPMQHWHTCV